MNWETVVAYQKFFVSGVSGKYKAAVVVLEADGYEPAYIGERGAIHIIGRNTAYEWMEHLGYVWDENDAIWRQDLPF